MATQRKGLVLLNDVLNFKLPEDRNGAFGVQYGTTGADDVTASTGTIVAEASIDNKTFYPLKITNNAKTDVDNLVAAGLGFCEGAGYTYGRVRMSVVGGAQGVMVSVNPREG